MTGPFLRSISVFCSSFFITLFVWFRAADQAGYFFSFLALVNKVYRIVSYRIVGMVGGGLSSAYKESLVITACSFVSSSSSLFPRHGQLDDVSTWHVAPSVRGAAPAASCFLPMGASRREFYTSRHRDGPGGRQLVDVPPRLTANTLTDVSGLTDAAVDHSLANWGSCPTPAKSEAIEYLQVGPTEIRYSVAWTIFVCL